jgi:predicted ATPase
VTALSWRALAQWLLGYPEAALADANQAINDARAIGQAATVMYAQAVTSFTLIHCGNYRTANEQADEIIALADEKRAMQWTAIGKIIQGCIWALTGKASDVVEVCTSAHTAYRSTGATLLIPWSLSNLARVYVERGNFDHAWRCIEEAMTAVEIPKDRLWEADVLRIAGEIAQRHPDLDAAKAEAYFDRALAVARQQQAKSWELRAAMSLARLWRDQGKAQQARELLAPVYGWFTEGFDTRDLKEAKALLEELAA